MSIFRVMKDPSNPYVMINKTALNDEQLSWKAKGLLCYMLSMPDDWQFYETELIKHSKDGRDSFRSAIKELVTNGYIDKGERTRNDKGFLGGYNYTVYENNIHSGKSYVGKPTTTNNDFNNNKYLHHSTNDEYILIELLDKYCLVKFNKPLRNHHKESYDLETYENMTADEFVEFLEDNVTKYDWCNLDYLESIQYRAQ